MTSLARTAIGHFNLKKVVDLGDLSDSNLSKYLLPSIKLLTQHPSINLDDKQSLRFSQGQKVPKTEKDVPVVSVLSPENKLLGVGIISHNILSPKTVLTHN